MWAPLGATIPSPERDEERPLAGRVLALDVGSVRVGVALSDLTRTIAQPHQVLLRRRDPYAAIAALVAAEEVGQVVVGRPLTLAGEAGLAVRAVEAFAVGLAPCLSCPWIWWDERLTTRSAERALLSGGMRRQGRRERIDKVAAAVLLQSYLDAQRKARGSCAGSC